MNKKAVSWIIIGVVIIAVVVIGVVAYWALTNTGGETGGGGEEKPDVAGATSLQFDVTATIEGVTEEYKFMAKNIGTSSLMLRVEQKDPEGTEFKYILNQAQKKVWVYYDGAWVDLSEQFATYWDQWNPALSSYKTNLENWTGAGDYEYTANGNSYKISNILVNPTLADSLFEPE